MGASAYVGRVGGLAVALGVGVAVATGHGVALAEPESDSSTSSVSAGPSADAADGSTGTAGITETDTEAPEDQGLGEDTDLDEDTAVDPGEDDLDDEAAAAEDLADPDAEAPPDDVPDDEPAEEPAEPDDSVVEAPTQTADVRSRGADRDNSDDAPQSTPLSQVSPATETREADVDEPAADTDVDTGVQTTTALQRTTALATTTLETTSQPRTFALTAAPVALTAPAEQPALQRLVVNVLSSLGIGALAANLPGAPVWSPFVMALLGLGTRREFSQPLALTRTAQGTPVAALAVTDAATAAVAAPTYPGTTRKPVYVSGNTHWIEFVTGPGNLNDTMNRFGIGGTDLGIMWDNGIEDDPTTAVNENQVLIAFGDTFSNRTPVRTGVWRFNTLFRSADGVLNNGLYVPNGVPVNHVVLPPSGAHFSGSPMERPNWSDPILPSPGDPVHPPYAIGNEVTIIPTAGISTPYNNAYGARQYMSFMSVRSWDSHGRWTTNYSGIAYSDDNGQTWDIAPTSIRTAAIGRATVPYVSGNQNFQQGAFVKPPAGSPEAADGWVYSYGTPSGRAGTVYVSRVQQNQILDVSKYQYWDGSAWVANAPAAAKPILPGKTTSFFGFFKRTTYPSVSEMSVQYNPYLDKYVMLYGDSSNKIVMRTADSPEGAWSAPTTLVSQYKLSGKYAPYVHPWSGTDELPAAEQHYLYWNLSTWNDYQVRLMRTDLTKV